MIPDYRTKYNSGFTESRYQAFLHKVNTTFGVPSTFRLSETPVFLDEKLLSQLIQACSDITKTLKSDAFKKHAPKAITDPRLLVPNEDKCPNFLQFDFGISLDANGNPIPQLIELQGFPSLYFFQQLLADSFKETMDIPAHYTHLFNGLNKHTYLKLLEEIIVGNHEKEQVVLLEVEPHTQNTRIDFAGAKHYLGIETVCLSEVIVKGEKLFYRNEKGTEVPIKRIFNRVIFDELLARNDFKYDFDLTKSVDVEWAGHPNWFFKISKHTLPILDSPFVPKTYFVDQLVDIPNDLENYVLKPLFSFSGSGVNIDVKKEHIEQLKNPSDYILQRKAPYEPLIQTTIPGVKSRLEVRMMMLWKDEWENPMLVNNLIRLTQGAMVGVKYNKNKRWVGASVGMFDPAIASKIMSNRLK